MNRSVYGSMVGLAVLSAGCRIWPPRSGSVRGDALGLPGWSVAGSTGQRAMSIDSVGCRTRRTREPARQYADRRE